MNLDYDFLNNYFRHHWKPSLSAYAASSYERISERISDDEYLLDVGCGDNPFKNLVKNCFGIDPANDGADLQVSIEDFVPTRKYDVITCLGSINFGDESIISRQVEKVVSCLEKNGRIFWRLNPGRKDHESELCKKVPFFPWSFEKLREFATVHGFSQVNETIDQDQNIVRLYAEWQKND
jgi:hypothetical protein